jgi:hypothetical protein
MNVLITSASREVGLVRAVAPRIGPFTDELVMLRGTEDRFIAGSALDAMGGTS